MEYGICDLSIVSLRHEPSHKSEITSQLLFGETYRVLEKQPEWLLVQCTHDEYEGWLDRKQHAPLGKREFDRIAAVRQPVSLDLVNTISSSSRHMKILIGSTLPGFDGMNFSMHEEKFIYNGQAIMPDNNYDHEKILEKCALKYLNAPYLWGGRGPFGIDCSGFTQMVFKLMGVKLKRDSYQQAHQGSDVDFTDLAKEGDLAFFSNKEGRIVHVGIILKGNRIIHASGKVRIDKMDAYGIFNEEIKKHSHYLKVIKRVL